MIEPEHPRLSIVRQCELVSISRSAYYGPVRGEGPLNLAPMRLIDEQFLETPWYGSCQMARHLHRQGYEVGRKRVRRLMAKMGLEAVYGSKVRAGLGRWITYYNSQRPYSALGGSMPNEAYAGILGSIDLAA